MMEEYWVVVARDEHHIYGGSGWAVGAAGSDPKGHATKAEAEVERTKILQLGNFDEKDLKVQMRMRRV